VPPHGACFTIEIPDQPPAVKDANQERLAPALNGPAK